MSTPILAIDGLSKHFGGQAALTAIDLAVEQGEFIALLGPSGCGKTTLLRCIAGFLTPEAGTVRLAGEDVTRLPPYRRPLNTVFQNYALFPHMSVADNVAYGPRRQGVAKDEAAKRAAEALELVGLAGFGERLPAQLSGGQQQRVALARAIVNRPQLLLLDEPLSALDLKLRKKVQGELKQIQHRLGIAFLFVTHDQDEAMSMADRIVLMNRGRIEQIGRGQDIYARPATRFAADFIGDANLLEVERRGYGSLSLLGGAITLSTADAPQGELIGVLRPEDILVSAEPVAGCLALPAVLSDIVHVGSHASVALTIGGTVLTARLAPSALAGLSAGQAVFANIRLPDLRLVPGDAS
ncbi:MULTISPECIES: ABC transporter ATP-binding protein [unclassified Bosea (in: a-proteobacteria)]|uniref:ABC transporter ATP-binding protein n=1 Tax=unclassified Bosea (in: a-proteobacteria) TaxID=2653178 RepID=UPI000F762EFA|nr:MULTISPECIES: ABC transporter ATP-binding protein [unclassified Bosea (in: a-proteobacteria)]AZO77042.1 Fe3+/spermidine/putrescine ABC transporter ATP-binding protein [Bosea sp. Tri-49]RXT21887.1 Fe3+/spermidine/putrescine ABC transporter ATP-binding protein [Bosea sp. Tri-39]RXT32226.1 Fe3+/spermidine/putrescine ABC transporter ATP-binding protein [Bosea sp. Tri-54]